jgi:hypothetical protein
MTTESALNFIKTKEYERFKEFCDACAKYKYIGICYGPPGVGKTRAARQYTNWDLIGPLLDNISFREVIEPIDRPLDPAVTSSDSIFLTSPTVRPVSIERNLTKLAENLELVKVGIRLMENHSNTEARYEALNRAIKKGGLASVNLVIIDEIDRLKLPTLEILRDIYDQNDIGMILIGMPGIEKRLSRYPQLYSRIGFAHEFKKMGKTKMSYILEHRWKDLGFSLDYQQFDNFEVVSKMIKLSNGNFRLLQRLFSQIDRVMEINKLSTITGEVVETARELLIIGTND